MHQLLKYIISFCLLLLVISHGVIQFGMFEFFHSNFRGEAERLINDGAAEQNQVLFSFERSKFSSFSSLVEWKDDNEFLFEGKLFDIIRSETKGDSIFLYCMYDEDDTILYSVLDSMIEDNNNDPGETNGSGSFLSQYYFCGDFDYRPDSPDATDKILVSPGSNLLDGVFLLTTPPPRSAA